MAIKIETLDNLEKAISLEVKNAKEYGERYNSNHEFYGVFLEEFEELKTEWEALSNYTEVLWQEIKLNQDIENNLKYLGIISRRLLAEASQVAAVIDKHLATVKENKECLKKESQ